MTAHHYFVKPDKKGYFIVSEKVVLSCESYFWRIIQKTNKYVPSKSLAPLYLISN